MDVLVVSGFLGSGKTTFLLSTLRYLSGGATRVAIIENEAGQIAIDGAVLRAQGAGTVPVRELYAGCICCTLRSDLTAAVAEVRTAYNPHLLLLEPSGVAGPDMVVESVRSALRTGEGERVTSIQIVDGRRVAGLLGAGRGIPPFLERSIQVCDVVLINKTEELDQRQCDSVRAWVTALGAQEIHVTDVRRTDAVRQVLDRQRGGTEGMSFRRPPGHPGHSGHRGHPGHPGAAPHHEALASATMPIPVDQQNRGTVVKQVSDLICAVAREVERRFPGIPGHIKGFLDPPGIAFNVAGEGDGVTVTAGEREVPPGEATLSIQVILAGEPPDQPALQPLLERVLQEGGC